MSSRRAKPRTATAAFQAGPGTVVALRYELFDAEGELVESSADDNPLVFLLGYGEASPALESAVTGLAEGDRRAVTLAPEEAFGARDPNDVIEVDRDELPRDLAVGDELLADKEDESGQVPLKVLEISDQVVVLDTNHPLAGQRVKLKIFVESVRPASAEELDTATERLTREDEPASQALLPAERLLRRKGGDRPREGDGPGPLRSGRVA